MSKTISTLESYAKNIRFLNVSPPPTKKLNESLSLYLMVVFSADSG